MAGNMGNKVVMLVGRSGVTVYFNKTGLRMAFSGSAIAHQEVKDEKVLAREVGTLLKKIGIHGKNGYLVLSDEVVFCKYLDKKLTTTAAVEEFRGEIPLAPNNLEIKLVPSREKVLVLAVNRTIYKLLAGVFEELGGRVEAVVPGVVFGEIGTKSELNHGEIMKFLGEGKLINVANLWVAEKSGAAKSRGRKMAAAMVMVMVTFGSLSAGVWYLRRNKTVTALQTSETVVEVTPSVEVRATPTLSIPSAADLSVLLLNGTETAGLAGRGKEVLVGMGFESIEVGNAQGQTAVTVILYDPEVLVSGIIVNQVSEELAKVFAGVETATASGLEADLVITVGRLK